MRMPWSEVFQTGGLSDQGHSFRLTFSLLACDWGNEHKDRVPRFTFFRLGVGCYKNIRVVLDSFIEVEPKCNKLNIFKVFHLIMRSPT